MIRSPLASTSLWVMPIQVTSPGGTGLGGVQSGGGKVEAGASSMASVVAAGASIWNQ
jgi:hypothetical protein